jgi:protein-tyrosine phosphatase
MVLSAGIAAMNGAAASPEAVETMAGQQIELGDHESQPLNERIARFADVILTMTRGHREAICAQWPEMAPRVQLLCHDKRDVGDPIGGPAELYQQCAGQIEDQLDEWIRKFEEHGMM